MSAFVVSAGLVAVRAASAVAGNSQVLACARTGSSFASSQLARYSFIANANVVVRNRRGIMSVPKTTRLSATRMRVAKDGDDVQIHYTGTLEDGSEFDSSRKRGIPFRFTVGAGQVIPGFDEAVRGLAVGESTHAVIPPEKGYGLRDEANIVSIKRDRIPNGMDLSLGAKVPLSNGSSATILATDDKEIKIDANHYLAGKTLTFDLELVDIVDAVLGPPAPGFQRLVCAAGCFWGLELAFQRVPGVVSTRVGYTQGTKESPKYREVCSGSTGHTEAVAVDFDPALVSYEKLLDLFWERLGGSALTRNRAGNDVGTQYRSGIYYLDDSQRIAAEESAKRASEKLGRGKPVVTEILPAEKKLFYLAEESHQRYLEKGGQCAEKNATEPIRCYG